MEKIELLGSHHKQEKKNLLGSPGPATNKYESYYTMSFDKVLQHFRNILTGLARGTQIFCFLHFCDVAEVAIIHKTVQQKNLCYK